MNWAKISSNSSLYKQNLYSISIVRLLLVLICCFYTLQLYAFTPQDSVRHKLQSRTDNAVRSYYFDHPDTVLTILHNYLEEAHKNQLSDQQFYILLNLASVASYMDSLQLLKSYLRQGEQLLQEEHKTISTYDSTFYMQSYYHFYWGRYYHEMMDFNAAGSAFEKILQLNSSIGDSLLIFNTHLNIAQAAYNMADYQEAAHHYHLAKTVLPQAHPSYAAGRGYEYKKAFINSLLGRALFYEARARSKPEISRQALNLHHKSLDVLWPNHKQKSHWRLVNTVHRRLAECYHFLDQKDSALFYIDRLLKLPTSSQVDQIQSHLLASSIYFEWNKHAESLHAAKRVLALCEVQYPNGHPYYGRGLYWLAKNENNKEAFSKAHQLLDSAQSYFSYYGDADTTFISDTDMIKIFELRGDIYRSQAFAATHNAAQLTKEAITFYKKAIEHAERLGQHFISAESRQYLTAGIYDVFEKGIETLHQWQTMGSVDESWADDAVYFFEKNRANQLKASINKLDAVAAGMVPEDIFLYEKELRMKIGYYKRLLAESNQVRYIDSLENAYEQYNKFRDSVQTEFPDYYALEDLEAIPRVTAMQEKIPDDEVVITFFWGQKDVYAMLISKDAVELINVDKRENLSPRLSEYLNVLHRRPESPGNVPSSVLAKGRALYEAFADVFDKVQDKPSWIVVPDGALGYLPFEALVTNYKEGHIDWLMNHHILHYGSSLRMLFANHPQWSKTRLSYLGFAPDYQTVRSTSARDERKDLGALQFNSREVHQANEIFNGRSFFGEKATEYNFAQFSEQANVIHLSVHAAVDSINPLYSTLYFVDKTGGSVGKQHFELDGKLHLYELYGYKLSSELAVLSACETGYGEWAKGEGIMSIGRAFEQAGCQSITMSLWQVNDRSTADIITHYFKNLDKGMEKHNALADAKKAFLTDPQNKYFHHPYYWSAFILHGDAAPLSGKDKLLSGWWIMAVAGGMATLIIVVIRRKIIS